MDVVEMVLVGRVNKSIVTLINQASVPVYLASFCRHVGAVRAKRCHSSSCMFSSTASSHISLFLP